MTSTINHIFDNHFNLPTWIRHVSYDYKSKSNGLTRHFQEPIGIASSTIARQVPSPAVA